MVDSDVESNYSNESRGPPTFFTFLKRERKVCVTPKEGIRSESDFSVSKSSNWNTFSTHSRTHFDLVPPIFACLVI